MRAALVLLALTGAACAQEPSRPSAQPPQLGWKTRQEPIYPQMARIAHIQGEVWIEIELSPAGEIVAMRTPTGHPLLVAAAVESLILSKLVCESCGDKNAMFTVLYRFTMPETPRPATCEEGNPVACLAGRQAATRRTRSARCLYLWKCGWSASPGGKDADAASAPQSLQIPVPAASGLPTRPSPWSVLRP